MGQGAVVALVELHKTSDRGACLAPVYSTSMTVSLRHSYRRSCGVCILTPFLSSFSGDRGGLAGSRSIGVPRGQKRLHLFALGPHEPCLRTIGNGFWWTFCAASMRLDDRVEYVSAVDTSPRERPQHVGLC